MRTVFVFFILNLLFVFPVYAQDSSGGYSMSYYCSNDFLRKLFNLSCEGVDTSVPAEETPQDPNRSIQLRFFTPPLPTNTPTPTTQPVQTNQNFQNAVFQNAVTSQVDWVYNGQGRCWAAWAQNSCSLIPQEGGGDAGLRDLDGNGGHDILCSKGTGTAQMTTIQNVSSKSFTIACERYACTSCKSADGTVAQCDGTIDPLSTRISEDFTITPGCVATCTINGAYGSCLSNVQQAVPSPKQPTTLPTQKPAPSSTPFPPFVPQAGGASSVRQLNKEVGAFYKMPWQVLEAILKIEGSHVFTLSEKEVIRYQQPGVKVPTNCTPNICSAAGPVQFTTGRDNRGSTRCSGCGLSSCPATWNAYRNAVLEAVSDGRTPNVCNLKDSVYAAGKMLKKNSGTSSSKADWTYNEVWKAAKSYYGSCQSCSGSMPGTGAALACNRLGMTYCDYVWNFYRKNP